LPNSNQYIVRLIDASRLLDKQATLNEGLKEIALVAAKVLSTDRCSVMLLEDADAADGDRQQAARLRVYGHFGDLPEIALTEAVPADKGIAGHVVSTGKPLRIDDINQSPFVAQARGGEGRGRGLVSVPIAVDGRVVGVININSPQDDRAFDDADVDLLAVFALFVGKSIYTFQLQKILQSRFVQMALERESAQEKQDQQGQQTRPTQVNTDPGRLAKIVAKTLYRELTAGGFNASQIIGVTSEVINLLQENLDKHKRRQRREQGGA
jgi:GAF domain-containing protein